MNKTSIEWVKNPDGSQGYTWNPITGCLNGCPYCYAAKLARGRLKKVYKALNSEGLPKGKVPDYVKGNERLLIAATDSFYPRFWPDRLMEPTKHKHPAGIFPVDMGDWCADWIPIEWSHSLIGIIVACPQHRFYLLTKQPHNLAKFSPFPPNCWVGITATDDSMFRIGTNQLREINATIKFVSLEPLLSWEGMDSDRTARWLRGIDWLIIGAQTKPYLAPQIVSLADILSAANHAGIPVFLKDNLYMIKPKRQEMPV